MLIFTSKMHLKFTKIAPGALHEAKKVIWLVCLINFSGPAAHQIGFGNHKVQIRTEPEPQRDFPEFLGDFPDFFEIFWDFSEFLGIFRDFSGFFGISRDFWGFFGIFRDFSGFFGISRDFPGFFGIFGDLGSPISPDFGVLLQKIKNKLV